MPAPARLGAALLLVGTLAATASATSTTQAVGDDSLQSSDNAQPNARTPVLAGVGSARVVLEQRDADGMRIDGRLDEAAWRGLEAHDEFRVIDPDTLALGALPTRVRMFYTAAGFYLGVDMEQNPATLVEHLSGRDQGWLNRDYFSFTLDTSGEGRYGFWFQLNLGNSVSDGTILPERQYSDNWDGAWHGATARTEDGWSAEFYIPWSLVDMPKADGARTIGLFAQRNVAHADERYAWPALPWTKPEFLSKFQPLGLDGVSPRQQYSFTPYASTSYDRFGDGVSPKAGADMLWRPSSNFQLAATLNPDFGNVEADDVVVNLTSYETFFPEKRLFFQEGQEVFATGDRNSGRWGNNNLSLLHTRRIGAPALLPQTEDGVVLAREGLGRPADLLGAVKGTGQSGSLRYGFLGVREDDTRFAAQQGEEQLVLDQTGRDFGAVRMLVERTERGYRALGMLSTAMRHPQREATVNAVDGQFISPSGRIRASTQLVVSDVTALGPSEADGAASTTETGAGGTLDVTYAPRQGLSHHVSINAFDDTIDVNDMGYQRRNDYQRVRYRMRVSSPNLERFRNMRTDVRVDRSWNTAGQVIDGELSVDQRLTLHNLAQIRFQGGLRPGRYDDRSSFGNGTYRLDDAWTAEVRYYSDSSRRLSYSVRQRWTEEPTGDGFYQRTQGFLRWRPTDRVTLGVGLRYVDRESWLLHRSNGAFTAFEANELMPNFDLSYFFTARQQLRMTLQWVAIRAEGDDFYQVPDSPGFLEPVLDQGEARDEFAISRMNLQLRYRWEIAPLSDLFLVYTNSAALPAADTRRGFGELFQDTVDQTIGENLVLKLRYRFGS